jgi:hypothetical protein
MSRLAVVVIVLVIANGCGEKHGDSQRKSSFSVTKGGDPGTFETSNDASRRTSAPLERKIIHDIDFDIVVTDFTNVPKKVDALVKEFDGAYVAQMALSGSEGQSRSGRWVVRVPLSGQSSFLAKVRAFGEVTREGSKADDVSEEFYDLEARLKNKRETEARLLKVQQEKTGELKDILEVEQQIDRVRGEIEQMQGRLDRLTTLTSLSTITINIREIRNYKPPQAVSLGDRAAGTFDESVEALREFGEGALLFLIAIAPWLPILIAVFFLARYLIRRAVRNATSRVTTWWKARTAETQTAET